MDVKWFFVVVAMFAVSAILIGMYFISLNQSLQDRSHFEQTQQSASERFDNNTTIHRFLFDNLTDLKITVDNIAKGLGDLKLMEDLRTQHYNKSEMNLQKLDRILDILGNDSSLPIIKNTTS